jgi:hypothetical protein
VALAGTCTLFLGCVVVLYYQAVRQAWDLAVCVVCVGPAWFQGNKETHGVLACVQQVSARNLGPVCQKPLVSVVCRVCNVRCKQCLCCAVPCRAVLHCCSDVPCCAAHPVVVHHCSVVLLLQ